MLPEHGNVMIVQTFQFGVGDPIDQDLVTEGIVGLCMFIEPAGEGAEDGGAFGTELQDWWLVG